jgi:hypothetical protein
MAIQNVSGTCYNTRMTNELVSSKYTFVCDPDECDCLIELTSSDGFGFPSGVTELTCPCGRKTTLLSVEHATIAPSTTTKEETMESTTTTTPVPDTYNSNLLVTYKVIRGYSDAEYATDKVASIEWDLHNGRQSQKRVTTLLSQIDAVKDIITEAYGDSEDQETLRSIAEALDIALTRTVEWSATIEVSGTMDLDLLADYDTDVESEIYDNLTVDTNNGNIEVIDQEVTNVREN